MGGRQSEPLTFHQQTKINRGRTTLTPKPNQFSRDLLIKIIPHLQNIKNVFLFGQINKKCASAIIFSKHNPFFSSQHLQNEINIFTGIKTISCDLQTLLDLQKNKTVNSNNLNISNNLNGLNNNNSNDLTNRNNLNNNNNNYFNKFNNFMNKNSVNTNNTNEMKQKIEMKENEKEKEKQIEIPIDKYLEIKMLNDEMDIMDKQIEIDPTLITNEIVSIELQLYKEMKVKFKEMKQLVKVKLIIWNEMNMKYVEEFVEQLLHCEMLKNVILEFDEHFLPSLKYAIHQLVCKRIYVTVKIHNANDIINELKPNDYLFVAVYENNLHQSLVDNSTFLLSEENGLMINSSVVNSESSLKQIMNNYWPIKLIISNELFVNGNDNYNLFGNSNYNNSNGFNSYGNYNTLNRRYSSISHSSLRNSVQHSSMKQSSKQSLYSPMNYSNNSNININSNNTNMNNVTPLHNSMKPSISSLHKPINQLSRQTTSKQLFKTNSNESKQTKSNNPNQFNELNDIYNSTITIQNIEFEQFISLKQLSFEYVKIGNQKQMNLPSTITQLSFSHCDDLKTLIIPSSISTITCRNCQSLQHLHFSEYPQLKELHIEHCNSIKSIHCCQTIETIELKYCTSITSLEYSINVKSIEIHNCYSLKKLPKCYVTKLIVCGGTIGNITELLNEKLIELKLASTSLPKKIILPVGIRKIEIQNCDGLEEFVNLNKCNFLTEKMIEKCKREAKKSLQKRKSTF